LEITWKILISMIRVFSGRSPLSSQFNSFHQTVAVTDGKFAVNAGTSAPALSGAFGVDKADPQPTSYPANTTFFISTSASRPLTVGSSVGSTYFLLTPGMNAVVDTSMTIQVEGGYSGSVQKVFNGNVITEYPLESSLFVDPPLGVYYLRLYDESDPVDLWESGNQTNRWFAAVPRTLGLTTSSQIQDYRGVVRVCAVNLLNRPVITVSTDDRVSDVVYTPWGAASPRLATSNLILSVLEAA
jgi:hypothetical protein